MRGGELFLPQMYVRECEIDVTIDLQSGILTGLWIFRSPRTCERIHLPHARGETPKVRIRHM